MTYSLDDLPAAGVRAMLSEAIDHHLSNCAGLLAGQPFRGIFRRSWSEQSEWDTRVGATRCTLSVDAALVPTAWAGQSAAPQPWHAHSQTLYLANSTGQVLTDNEGQPIEPVPAVSRQTGAPVEITLGEGAGSYRITEAIPADGGRAHLVLEIAA